MRVFWLFFWMCFGFALHAQQAAGTYTVYLFLLEDCKITQAYTDRLHEIYDKYQAQGIRFEGLFANPVSNDSTVAEFATKYDIPFACKIDRDAVRARAFGVTVTPEVVLFDENAQNILYQGRIDNMFERVGQRRQVVTSFELEAALHAVTHDQPVPIPRTNAVGCYLPISKP